TGRMMRRSESFLQARAKAWRGASSRATDSSSPAARRESMSAASGTVTPEHVQVMISPSSGVPSATSIGGFANAFMGLVSLEKRKARPGCRSTEAGRDESGERSDREGTLDSRFLDGERRHNMKLVADEAKAARWTLNHQRDETGFHQYLPGI